MKGLTTFAAILLAVSAAPELLAQDVAVQVKEKSEGLLARATVKPDSAQKIALASVPGGKITEVEIEEEDGKLVYEIDIAAEDGSREIYVDATTGAIVAKDDKDDKADEPAAMGAGISEGEPGLLAEATIKADSAERIAVASVPGGTITNRKIERKDGKLFYSFEIKVEGKDHARPLRIDASTGEVLKD